MQLWRILSVCMVWVGLSLAALAAADAADEEQIIVGVNCVNGAVKRRLEAQTKSTGCVLFYTKAGKTEQIAKAKTGVEVCTENLKKVRVRLEEAGYRCE